MSAHRRRHPSNSRLSVEKSSSRRRSINRHLTEPSEDDVLKAAGVMDMDFIRNSDTYKNVMPSSFKINGRKVPKSQLRKHELVRFYLEMGGKIVPKKQKELKLWTPPRKISQEERAKARLEVQKTKDHHGSTKRSSHRRASREPSEHRKLSSSRRPSLSKRSSSTKKHAPVKRKSSSRRTDSLERYMQKLRVQEPISDSDSEAEEDVAEQPDKPEEDELEEDSEEVTFI